MRFSLLVTILNLYVYMMTKSAMGPCCVHVFVYVHDININFAYKNCTQACIYYITRAPKHYITMLGYVI